MGVVGFLRKGELKKAIERQADFKASQQYFGKDGDAAVAVDESRHLVCLVKALKKGVFKQDEFRASVFAAADLAECEIIEDGYSRERTSGSGSIGRALVGDVLGGPTGALVGGLGAERKVTKTVTRVDLRIVIRHGSDPVNTICFRDYEVKKGTWVGDAEYKKTTDEANHWLHLLRNMMRIVQELAPAVAETLPVFALAASKQTDDEPGQFEVFGVDKESSMDTRDVIRQDSAANARVKVELQGVIVTKVRRMAD